MASNYPSEYDVFTLPNSGDKATPSHAELHRNTSQAIEAIQGTLGLNPQNPNSTVAARLAAIQAQIDLLQGEIDQLAEGIIPTGNVQAAGTQGQIQYNNNGSLAGLNNGDAGQLLISNGAGVAPSFSSTTVNDIEDLVNDVENLQMVVGGLVETNVLIGAGAETETTDSSGDVVVTHGMGGTPTAVVVTARAASAICRVQSKGTTTFTVRFLNTATGAALPTTSVGFDWIAVG